jgi:hypothetical protein
MSSNCPTAPPADPGLVVQTTAIPKGKALFRFHNSIHPAISFDPNFGKHIDVPEEGARFNPFPGAPASNIPTLYAADTLTDMHRQIWEKVLRLETSHAKEFC